MKPPYLRRQEEVKTAHGYTWSDYYSWIHQSNCLEILQDKSKLNPDVRLDEPGGCPNCPCENLPAFFFINWINW